MSAIVKCNGTYNCSCQSSWLCFIVLSVFSLQIFMINYINILIKNQHQKHRYNELLSASSASDSNSSITINILQIENLEIKLPKNKIFYEIKNNFKFFTENEHHPHLDKIYGNNEISKEEIHETLKYLFIEFKNNFLGNITVNYSQDILYWLEYGTLLGSYREKDIISWDDDGDIGIFDFILNELPIKYESMEWIFKRNPNINSYIYDSRNTVSARFISKINGVFIDIFSYSIINDTENDIKYVYNLWSLNNFDFWQILDDLLPINQSGIFLQNHTFNIPHNTKQWLLNEYDSLEPPMEKLWIYDDNFTFNDDYWYNYDYRNTQPFSFQNQYPF